MPGNGTVGRPIACGWGHRVRRAVGRQAAALRTVDLTDSGHTPYRIFMQNGAGFGFFFATPGGVLPSGGGKR